MVTLSTVGVKDREKRRYTPVCKVQYIQTSKEWKAPPLLLHVWFISFWSYASGPSVSQWTADDCIATILLTHSNKGVEGAVGGGIPRAALSVLYFIQMGYMNGKVNSLELLSAWFTSPLHNKLMQKWICSLKIGWSGGIVVCVFLLWGSVWLMKAFRRRAPVICVCLSRSYF